MFAYASNLIPSLEKRWLWRDDSEEKNELTIGGWNDCVGNVSPSPRFRIGRATIRSTLDRTFSHRREPKNYRERTRKERGGWRSQQFAIDHHRSNERSMKPWRRREVKWINHDSLESPWFRPSIKSRNKTISAPRRSRLSNSTCVYLMAEERQSGRSKLDRKSWHVAAIQSENDSPIITVYPPSRGRFSFEKSRKTRLPNVYDV